MTGYPESLTDPSYAGQLMTLTYPLVAITVCRLLLSNRMGLPLLWRASISMPKPLFVSDYSENYSHWNAVESLGDWLKREQIPASRASIPAN